MMKNASHNLLYFGYYMEEITSGGWSENKVGEIFIGKNGEVDDTTEEAFHCQMKTEDDIG
jgi:hypothetical protein